MNVTYLIRPWELFQNRELGQKLLIKKPYKLNRELHCECVHFKNKEASVHA